MDFTEEEKTMRLKSLHPGVTREEVELNTGFSLVIPNSVPTTTPPTEEELDVLRTRVDKTGILRGT